MKKIITIAISTCFFITSCEEEFISEIENPQTETSNNHYSKSGGTPSVELPINLSNDFIWGINGHNGNASVDYVSSPNCELEIELLNEHQITHYRVDVYTDSLGKVKDNIDRFEELVNLAFSNEIEIVPVIIIRDHFDNLNVSEIQAFNLGRNQARGFAREYKNKLNYYSLGNEHDRDLLLTNNQGYDLPGMEVTDYDFNKFLILASYYRGMIEGIRREDPTAKIIIDGAGFLHWGYFTLLEDQNLDFDIIGYHWYSNMGSLINGVTYYPQINLLEELAIRFTKPIWLTEINQKNGTNGFSEVQQSNSIYNYINELDNMFMVKAFFIYELYDQPANLVGWGGANESKYGIVKWGSGISSPPNYNSYEYKIASKTYKFEIEEAMNGYEDYAYCLYNSLLYRDPFPNETGLNFWTNRLKSHQNQSLINNEFYHDGGIKVFIRRQYDKLLDTPNPPLSDQNYWYNLMATGYSREELILYFVSSQQFWLQSDENEDTFIRRVYLKLHNRPVTPGYEYWVQRLETHTRQTVVHEIMKSQEYIKNSIKDIYRDILDREPTISELNSRYTQIYNDDINQELLIKELLLTQEYWDNAIIKGYERRTEFSF